MNAAQIIENGKACLGIELGSTRIKAILIDSENQNILASGNCNWENRLENGIWTYHEDEIKNSLQECYLDLKKDVLNKYNVVLKEFKALGISAMMHGFLALDKDDKLLCPFKTWRNTSARQASAKLTEELDYNIPERWSIAHLYDAMLKHEEYVPKIRFFTTLAGFIHYKLTGEKILGIGDASGMFPINYKTHDYHQNKVELYNNLANKLGYEDFDLKRILPKINLAGSNSGTLTNEGAKFLDPQGDLKSGCILCPPEGDAGTGMVATNTIKPRTGNVSVGTSIFAMLVLENELKSFLREVDNVATPDGSPVAMIHANNCSSELNAQIGLFKEFAQKLNQKIDNDEIFKVLFQSAEMGEPDCGGVNIVPYFSGEFITNIEEGRPLIVRNQNAHYNLNNLMRAEINSAFCALRIGFDTLAKSENIVIDRLVGHGGLFKTKGIAQGIMSNALGAPVEVMTTAGEGGAYGIAVLASFSVNTQYSDLGDFLDNTIYKEKNTNIVNPTPELQKGFDNYLNMHKKCLEIEKRAVEVI